MKEPQIKGFVETSFCDWDGKVASVIFLPGCNMRCPFCQNRDLVVSHEKLPVVELSSICRYLQANRSWIDGIVLTGGEPTLSEGLEDLAARIRQMGFGVKLDTNGTRPEVIEYMIVAGLVDYIAMDIKAPLDRRYDSAAGVKVDLLSIRRSIELVAGFGDTYEFRTTLVPGLVGEEEIDSIARSIRGAKRYALQRFVPQKSLDNSLRRAIPYGDTFVARLLRIAGRHVESCFYRGKIGVGLS